MPEERHQENEEARRRAEETAAMAERKAEHHGTQPQVHTGEDEGHPAGQERSARDIGGPTSPSDGDGQATGGAPGTRENERFETHE